MGEIKQPSERTGGMGEYLIKEGGRKEEGRRKREGEKEEGGRKSQKEAICHNTNVILTMWRVACDTVYPVPLSS